MSALSTFWLKNKRSAEDSKHVHDVLGNSKPGLDLLKELLEQELLDVQKEIRSRNSYEEITNWDRWVADRLGYARCLDKLIERLSF